MRRKCIALIDNRKRQATELPTIILFNVINTNTKDVKGMIPLSIKVLPDNLTKKRQVKIQHNMEKKIANMKV